MGLNETTRRMRDLLAAISVDIEKAANGNKAASQRVRTGSIRLEKTAKVYRKESISAEKSGNFPKKGSKKAQSKAQSKQKAQPKQARKAMKPSKQAKVKANPKAKALFNPQRKNMAKRPTAKIPFRKA